MAAVNEAWHVLGDAGRRRQYDRGQQAAAAPRPAPAPRQTPSAEDVPPADQTADAVTRAVHGAPLIAMLVVLLLIFVVSVFAAHGARTPHGAGASDGVVQVGSCVLVATGEPVLEVPCTEPHDGRAAAVIPLDLACPADTDYYVAPGGTARVCVAKGE